MIRVLFLWPIGVRKAQLAATATVIRKGSGLTPRLSAILTATGAAMTAVATLFMMSESVIVTTISTVRMAQAGQPAVWATMVSAISLVPPEFSRAMPSGINEASNTMTGHSIELYTSRGVTMLKIA